MGLFGRRDEAEEAAAAEPAVEAEAPAVEPEAPAEEPPAPVAVPQGVLAARVMVSHDEPDHPNSEAFAWRKQFERADDAVLALEAAGEEYPPEQGYRLSVEVLHADEAGQGIWTEVT